MIIYNSRSFPTIFLADLLKFRNCVCFNLLGSFFMIIGLFTVSWAKVEDMRVIKQDTVVGLLHESFREQEY